MSDIETLRKSLALSSEGLASEDKKTMAIDAITKILDALEIGVGAFGEWEQRCLAASIIALRAGKYDDSRALARRAIWPEENRRNSGVARLLLRPVHTPGVTRLFPLAGLLLVAAVLVLLRLCPR